MIEKYNIHDAGLALKEFRTELGEFDEGEDNSARVRLSDEFFVVS